MLPSVVAKTTVTLDPPVQLKNANSSWKYLCFFSNIMVVTADKRQKKENLGRKLTEEEGEKTENLLHHLLKNNNNKHELK